MKIINELSSNFDLSDNGVMRCKDYKKAFINKHGNKHVLIGSYLHIIFKPIEDNNLDLLLREIGVELPEDYTKFLKKYNGLVLYSGSLSIYGFGREVINGLLQVNRNPSYEYPFHLSDYNQNIKSNNLLVIGSFNDMRLCYKVLDLKKSIYLLDANDKVLNQWENIDEAMSILVNKLASLYDQNGVVKNPKVIGKYVFNRPSKI